MSHFQHLSAPTVSVAIGEIESPQLSDIEFRQIWDSFNKLRIEGTTKSGSCDAYYNDLTLSVSYIDIQPLNINLLYIRIYYVKYFTFTLYCCTHLSKSVYTFHAGHLCDAVMVADDIRFPVHRAIMAANSPYFRALFTNGMRETDEKEVSYRYLSIWF